MAMPTLVATPCPSGPVVVSTPEVQRYSGCPAQRLPNWRNDLISSSVTEGLPRISYSGSTALTLARCRMVYSNVDACPEESTKRSRFIQMGSSGSNRKSLCHRQYTVGDMSIGVPGCPEFAFWSNCSNPGIAFLNPSAGYSFHVANLFPCRCPFFRVPVSGFQLLRQHFFASSQGISRADPPACKSGPTKSSPFVKP